MSLPESVEVSVIQADIDLADKELKENEYAQRCYVCPVAQALIRMFPGYSVMVGADYGVLIQLGDTEDDDEQVINLAWGDDTHYAIRHYDRTNDMQPFKFRATVRESLDDE